MATAANNYPWCVASTRTSGHLDAIQGSRTVLNLWWVTDENSFNQEAGWAIFSLPVLNLWFMDNSVVSNFPNPINNLKREQMVATSGSNYAILKGVQLNNPICYRQTLPSMQYACIPITAELSAKWTRASLPDIFFNGQLPFWNAEPPVLCVKSCFVSLPLCILPLNNLPHPTFSIGRRTVTLSRW